MDAKASNAMVPDNIIRMIREKGLKHCTVADRAGFTAQQLSDMLNGRKIIKACDSVAIAEALGVEVAELYAADQCGA